MKYRCPAAYGEMTAAQREWWSCKRKVAYKRGEAKIQIALEERKYKIRLYFYKCGFCKMYHLTKNWHPFQ